MKALTLHQPWATLCALGVKTIETRSWRAPDALIGQRIAIHASKVRPEDAWPWPGGKPYTMWLDERGDRWLQRYEFLVDPDKISTYDEWPLPLGAIVGSAVLAACVPMVDLRGEGAVYRLTSDPHLVVYVDHPPWGKPSERADLKHYPRPARGTDVTDQLPFGDFAPGRWAWLLEDAAPTTERCPWCGGDGGTWDAGCAYPCPACSGSGRSDPISARGQQRVWEWAP